MRRRPHLARAVRSHVGCSVDKRRIAGRLATAATVALAVPGAMPAGGADGLERLAGLREEVILHGAIIDGNRLDLSRFTDHRPPERLRRELRRWMEQRRAPVHEFERDGWLVLVQAVDAGIETIEIRSHGSGAAGRRTRLSRTGAGSVDASDWLEDALPPQSRVLRRITHRDGSRRMTTLVALTDLPAGAALEFVVEALRRHGFQAASGSTPSFAGPVGEARVLSRGSEEIALSVSARDSGRGGAVVMHWGRAER